jgi:hypothetical protein
MPFEREGKRMNERGSPSSEESPSPAKRMWGALLAVAGAAVGLAAVVYLIGAATLWLALRDRGYSPDVGIEHQPRSQVMGLGFRGIIFVGALTLLAAAAAALTLVIPKIRTEVEKIRFRFAVAGALAALLLASAFSWRWLALAIAGSTLALVIAFHLRLPKYRRQWHWLVLPVAAALTAISWQYGSPVYIQSTAVIPTSALPLDDPYYQLGICPRSDGTKKQPPQASRAGTQEKSSYAWIGGRAVWVADRNRCKAAKTREQILQDLREACTVPYFGQSGDFVYLGSIRRVWQDKKLICRWKPGPIVEVRRDEVRLQFLHQKAFLNQNQNRPISAAWGRLTSFFDKLA